MAKTETPEKFGPTYPNNYPTEMRTQLWPLCCGARIISGFKNVATLTEDELDTKIQEVISAVPDHQVYGHETMKPKLVFLTLNYGQMTSKKLVKAVERAGFKKFAEASPRGAPQGFYILDQSNSFKSVA